MSRSVSCLLGHILLQDILHYWAGIGVSGFHINDVEYLAENSTLVDDDAVSV